MLLNCLSDQSAEQQVEKIMSTSAERYARHKRAMQRKKEHI